MTDTNENSGCLSALFPFLKRSKKEAAISKDETASKELPYRLRDDFLSPVEFSFYKVLSSVVGAQLIIQSKVRLADIFFVSRPNENRSFLSKIAQKHLDFLVCDPATMQPLFGIELDDSSHKRNDRQERDEFVEEVFQVARLPLVRFPAQREYNSREIAAQIAPFLKDKIGVSASPTPQPQANKPVSAVPICSKCGIPMLLRTVSQGEHKGKQFYGCQNYPRCRVMLPYLA
ncbi:MAG: topoisomerase [Chloroflexi bacterium HGW-Chloroflexi-10]|nr:MAG: topoisomerase [Chloroflexi bacterium HGW-Chloroflexi-10]